MSFEYVPGRIPVNKNTAMALAGGCGYQLEPKQNEHFHSEIMPKLGVVPPGRREMIGKRSGRLIVVGVVPNKTTRWYVRCDCGAFEIRGDKALSNPKNKNDRCLFCWKVAHIKRNYDRAKKGDKNIKPVFEY